MPGRIPEPHEMEFDDTGCLSDGLSMETKPIYLPDYQKVNPCCEPAWRWQRGTRLAQEGTEYSPATDDRETGYALKFIRELKACKSAADREALAKRVPGLYFAYRIYTEGGPSKWVIEARILAGQSLRDVAQAMGVSKETVYLYQKLFFHVVPRLSASDYVRHKIIGKTAFKGIGPDDAETLLKLFGFYGGPHVLDLVISYLLSGFGCGTSDITNADPKLAEKIRRAIELLSIPDDVTLLLKFLQEGGGAPDGERALESLKDALEVLKKKLSEKTDDAGLPASENDLAEVEDAVEDARAIDPLEEYERGQAPQKPEEDSQQSEPDHPHPDWPPESDEDLREKA